jgi:hypothetical protein
MKRKTWDTVNASIVEAIPNRTSSVIQLDARRVEVANAAPDDMSADYKRPRCALLSRVQATFIKQYQRKHYKNTNSNDRSHDRDIEAKLKRMSPEELHQLLHGDE